MQNMMALVFLLRKHLGSQMLRAGYLVRGDSSNLGHGCIPSMCIECWPCTTCATAESIAVGPSVIQEILITCQVGSRGYLGAGDTTVHKSPKIV